MSKYICSKCDHEQEGRSVTIRVVDGEVRRDIKCDKCDNEMDLKEPKSGVPSFRSNRWGQVM